MITGQHYQNAYIVADIDVAIAEFRTRAEYGEVRPFAIEQELWTPDGLRKVSTKLCFIWIGDLQYELIEVVEDESGIYSNWQGAGQPGGGLLHFHHVCMRVPEWELFRAAVAEQDLPVVLERANEGDQLKFLYLDARAFCGHYLEYVWMSDERWAQLRAM